MFARSCHPPPRPRLFFFFNDTATTEIYTLSLHDALPICLGTQFWANDPNHTKPLLVEFDELPHGICRTQQAGFGECRGAVRDRKSTRLNSSHSQISYAVFCLKKKKVNHTALKCSRR